MFWRAKLQVRSLFLMWMELKTLCWTCLTTKIQESLVLMYLWKAKKCLPSQFYPGSFFKNIKMDAEAPDSVVWNRAWPLRCSSLVKKTLNSTPSSQRSPFPESRCEVTHSKSHTSCWDQNLNQCFSNALVQVHLLSVTGCIICTI